MRSPQVIGVGERGVWVRGPFAVEAGRGSVHAGEFSEQGAKRRATGGDHTTCRLERVIVGAGRVGSTAVCVGTSVGTFPDLPDDERVQRGRRGRADVWVCHILDKEAPEDPRAVLEATGATIDRRP